MHSEIETVRYFIAFLFFFQTSKHYELINYSEHGTTVDNVLYSCDFSDKKAHSLGKTIEIDSPPVEAVKQVIKRGRKSTKLQAKDGQTSKDAHKVAGKKNDVRANGESNSMATPVKAAVKKELQQQQQHNSGNVERVSVQVQAHNSATMNSKSGQPWKPCACKSSCSTLIGGNGAGWEGTALLHHGSYIKIGCIQFVFSITNYGTSPASPSCGVTIKQPTLSENK